MRRIVKATRISPIYELHSRMILQQIQCPLKANYPVILFRAHSYIVGKYSLELPISQTSTFSNRVHFDLWLIDYLADSVMRSLVVTICIDQPLHEKALNQPDAGFNGWFGRNISFQVIQFYIFQILYIYIMVVKLTHRTPDKWIKPQRMKYNGNHINVAL